MFPKHVTTILQMKCVYVSWVVILFVILLSVVPQLKHRINRVETSSKRTSVNGVHGEQRHATKSATSFEPLSSYEGKDNRLDYKTTLQTLIRLNTSADDPKLINLIRNYYIDWPSTQSYNLDTPYMLDYSQGQTPFIVSRLNFMEGGFYVECGAYDGEKLSTSLFFERVRKWNGLLIEPDPTSYSILLSKHRKAFSINACLSPQKTPAKFPFSKSKMIGRLVYDQETIDLITRHRKRKSNIIDINCFPLLSMMLALNRTTIDFLSLDVEGDELNVLKFIPFDKLNIKMLAVEYAHVKGGAPLLRKYMESKGYKTVLEMHNFNGGVKDLIFKRQN